MAATPTLGFPYPVLGDPNNPPADFKALAEALEAYLTPRGEPRAGTRTTSAAQNIPTGTTTAAVLETASGLSGGVTSSSGGLRAPVDGWYIVDGSWLWTANGTGYRRVELYINGGPVIARDTRAASGADQAAVELSRVKHLTAGDIVKLQVTHSAGVTLASSTITELPHLALACIREDA